MSEYERLENEKRNGWSKYNNSNHSSEERYEGAMIVISCHFQRSVNANPERHIRFNEYVSSWLSANQSHFQEVRAKLLREYPPLSHSHLECGTSYFT
ncbi:hypothetical protein AB4158_18175 [Vibrio splendidus]|uniref:hypothetical protein n=1 Tax=Vibrio cyclitrophicus TaxID=47951 RepID=UPI001054F468|nr:hypothetical protein [Vibrio cyclitrophicus]